MKLAETVQKAKEINGLTSDKALAAMMHVSDVAVLRWRREECVPTPEHAQRLAELAGIDPAPFIAETIQAAAKDEGLKGTMERIKRALATAAAALPALVVAIHHCILCKIRKTSDTGQIQARP